MKEYVIKYPGKTIITIDDHAVRINRKGFFNFTQQGLKGEKTIPFKSITSIQVKKPGITNGYMQFGVQGGVESKKGLSAAATDENTVVFSNKYYKEILEIKEFIESKIYGNDKTSTMTIAKESSSDEIRKYKDLLDEGIISEEEFNAKKKQLLGI